MATVIIPAQVDTTLTDKLLEGPKKTLNGGTVNLVTEEYKNLARSQKQSYEDIDTDSPIQVHFYLWL